MYSSSDLKKYDFFKEALKANKIEYILDTLTGVINRKFMLEYVKHLIDFNVPFRLAIMDLDDFKLINDKYGHFTGDIILESVASNLVNYVNDKGLVGRFGGDEFVLVLFDLNDYKLIHKFYCGMLKPETKLLRSYYKINEEQSIFITATIGCAAFPDDAKNFDELFLMSDKTLYRGKAKGRNCFIIYVHEKHKDFQIQKIHNDDEATIIFNINSKFDELIPLNQKLLELSSYIKNNLNLDNIFYIDSNSNLYDIDDFKLLKKNTDLSSLKFNNELYRYDYKGDVERSPIGDDIKNYEIASLLITRIKVKDEIKGYIMYALKRTAKIWQNNEIATLMFLAKTISLEIK